MSDRLARVGVLAFLAVASASTASAQHAQLPGLTTSGASAQSSLCDLSRDGRWLAYSVGVNDPGTGDTNNLQDIWVRDLVTGARIRASVDENGAPWTDQAAGAFEPYQGMFSGNISVSDGGERVAFVTQVDVPFPPPLHYQVRVFDRAAGTSQLVSRTLAGTAPAAASKGPVISGNGRHVLFWSSSDQLVTGDTNVAADLFVRDLVTQTTTRVVENPPGVGLKLPNYDITADGRFITHSRAVAGFGAELVLLDRDSDADGVFDEPGAVLTTTLVPAVAGTYHHSPALSASGRFVAFLTESTSGGGAFDVRRLDRDSDGNGTFDEPGGTAALTLSNGSWILFQEDLKPFHPAINGDGSRVAWIGSNAAQYFTETAQIFVWDAALGIRLQTYNETTGEAARGLCGPLGPAISGDGQRLAYTADALNLVTGDPLGYDVMLFQYDAAAPAGLARYCYGAPNSVGNGARMGWTGAPSVGQNAFFLTVSGCPPGTSGLFFYGPTTTGVPFGNGFRCMNGPFFRLGAQVVDGAGGAVRQLRFDQPPASSGPGALLPGSGWNFQFHYRNPAAGGAGFNTSDGLHVPFYP